MVEEASRIEQNLKIIRGYLLKSFIGFDVVEDTSTPGTSHAFSLSHRKTGEQVRLRVAWARLSEESNTPERTARSLEHGGVAGKMRSAKGNYFDWEFRL